MVKGFVATDLNDERIDEESAGTYTNLIRNGGACHTRSSYPAGETVGGGEMESVRSNFVDPNYGMIHNRSPRNSFRGKPVQFHRLLGRQSAYMSENDEREDRRTSSDEEHSCGVRRVIIFQRHGNRTTSSCR